MGRLLRMVVFCVVLVLMVSCVSVREESNTPYQETIKMAREVGNSLTNESGKATAVSIAVMHEGKLVFSEGFGLRDIESSLPVDRYTRFNMGSVSKIFTATAVLLLQQDGKLDLDDKVADVLPDFTMADERYKDITIRMLLSHTSGMAGTNWLNGFSAGHNPDYLNETLEELRQSTLKHDPGVFSPYCNDGFTVAQAVVEHLSSMPFAQFLQERIFDPLEMELTSAGFLPGEDNVAYAYDSKTTRLPLEIVNILASGGLTTTTEDLCKFALRIFSPTEASPSILSPESIDEFMAEQIADFALEMDFTRLLTYGLGWDFVSWEPYHQQGVRVLGKTGGTMAYTTMLFAIPGSHSAVALTCAGQVDPIGVTLPILDALLKETGQISLEPQQTEEEPSPVVPLPDDYTSYVGYYGSGNGIYHVEFDVESSSMLLSKCDESSSELVFTGLHKGNGIYGESSGFSLTLRTLLGTPSVLSTYNHFTSADMQMTRIPELSSAPEYAFTEGIWLPENFTTTDLVLQLYQTAFWDALPSYLVVTGEASIPYAITSASNTSMVLPALRDQMQIRTSTDGRLMIGAYRCIKTDDVEPLHSEELVESGASSSASSVWRSIPAEGKFSCEIPSGGRILVLASDYSSVYDSLIDNSLPASLDVAGGYVAFIADSPMVFQPLFQPEN